MQNVTWQAELNALSNRQVAEREANRIRDVDCRALIEKLIASNAVLLAENIALQVTSRTNDGALIRKDLQLAQLNLHCALTLEIDGQREEVSILRSHYDALQAALASKDLQLVQLNLHCSALTLERDEQRGELSKLRARNDTLQAELRDVNVAMHLTVCCPSPSSRMLNLKFSIKFLSGDNNMHLLFYIPLFVM